MVKTACKVDVLEINGKYQSNASIIFCSCNGSERFVILKIGDTEYTIAKEDLADCLEALGC